MKVLAINFGHDASLALFVEQKMVSFLELERVTRLKHTVGVSQSDIELFLEANSTPWAELDFVALAGTQWYKAKHSSSIRIETADSKNDLISSLNLNWQDNLNTGGTDKWYDYEHHQKRLGTVAQTDFPLDAVSEGISDPNNYSFLDDTLKPKPFQSIYPYTIEISGIKIPATFVPHHLAHAGYGAFYRNKSETTQLILSHDGGWPHIPFNSGGIFLFKEGKVYPLLDPRLFLGQLYQIMGERAGFRPSEAPGKLMGLASYGIPDPEALSKIRSRVETLTTRCARITAETFHEELKTLCDMVESEASNVYLRKEASLFEFNFPDVRKSIGIAAYSQKLVEQIWAGKLAVLLESMVDQYQVTDTLAVVGGFSLNCPGNSLLQSSLTSLQIKPLPGGSDMGVAIGAGAIVSSFLTGKFPIDDSASPISPAFPPRPPISKKLPVPDLKKHDIEDVLGFYASALVEGKIFCHVEGPSEVGPRALGNRSIIAHAANPYVRDTINQHKGREMWRPLAPIVRASDFTRFFEGPDSGEMSRFMLSTYRVKNPAALPAVTHVDNTARAQMVEQGTISDLLARLNEISEVPVVVNTSFNVAGEPLVETAEQTIASFALLKFDYLYLEGSIYTLET